MLREFQAEERARRDSVERQINESMEAAARGRKAVAEMQAQQKAFAQLQARLKHTEEQLTGSQKYVLKLENENSTLRKVFELIKRASAHFATFALQGFEETMHRLKNFSSDDNSVDRRLVVKMLVTYFERNEKVRFQSHPTLGTTSVFCAAALHRTMCWRSCVASCNSPRTRRSACSPDARTRRSAGG